MDFSLCTSEQLQDVIRDYAYAGQMAHEGYLHDLAELRHDLGAALAERDIYKAKSDVLAGELATLKTSHDGLKIQCKAGNVALAREGKMLNDLQKASAARDKYRSSVDDLTEKLTTLQANYDALKKKNAPTNLKRKSTAPHEPGDVETLKAGVAEWKDKANTIARELSVVHANYADLKAEYKKVKASNDQLGADAEKTHDAMMSMHQRLENMRNAIVSSNGECCTSIPVDPANLNAGVMLTRRVFIRPGDICDVQVDRNGEICQELAEVVGIRDSETVELAWVIEYGLSCVVDVNSTSAIVQRISESEVADILGEYPQRFIMGKYVNDNPGSKTASELTDLESRYKKSLEDL